MLHVVLIAGATVKFTATLINMGNIALVGAKVVLTDVPTLTCKSGDSAATNIPVNGAEYTNDGTATLAYGAAVVCTGTYTFSQASYEALTSASKSFSVSMVNATTWTATAADNGFLTKDVSAQVQPTVTITFQSDTCTKPATAFGKC